jgi:hypothetical protein
MEDLNSLLELRERIRRKSHDYFMPYRDRHQVRQRRLFDGATDALLDASAAAASYSRAIGSDAGVNLLACYGFLQALNIQQDAVWNLCKALELSWKPHDEKRLLYIRDLRNRLCGHPASADQRDNKLRPSSAIILGRVATPEGFICGIYYDDDSNLVTKVMIFVASILAENEQLLAKQIRKVEIAMDKSEQDFRQQQSKNPFLDCFGRGFPYSVQALRCDLSDSNSVPLSQAHAETIREIIVGLKESLQRRGFPDTISEWVFDRVFVGIEVIEEMLKSNVHTPKTQHIFELLYSGLKQILDDLQKRISELDEELNKSI